MKKTLIMGILGTFFLVQNTLANPSDWTSCKSQDGQSTFDFGLHGAIDPTAPMVVSLTIHNVENGSKSLFYGTQSFTRNVFDLMNRKGAFSFALKELSDNRVVKVTLSRQLNSNPEIDTYIGTITTPYRAFEVHCE